MNNYLTEEQFERLAEQSQRDFYYCPICEGYHRNGLPFDKIEETRQRFIKDDIKFIEIETGIFKVSNLVNETYNGYEGDIYYWVVSEKWFNSFNQARGQGFASFLRHLTSIS